MQSEPYRQNAVRRVHPAQDSVITTGLFGIGRYRHVKSIANHNIGNTNNSVLTIHD